MSHSLIARQQRQAGLSGSYGFHRIRLCADTYGQHRVCALLNSAAGKASSKVFDLNAENGELHPNNVSIVVTCNNHGRLSLFLFAPLFLQFLFFPFFCLFPHFLLPGVFLL